MITQIIDRVITWECLHKEDEDEPPCGLSHTITLDEIVYRYDGTRNRGRDHHAMLLLPPCTCGATTFLKADFTWKELYRTLLVVRDEETGAVAYILSKRFFYSVQAHWLLYEAGKAELPPLVEMPPQALLSHPQFACIERDTIAALWCGFAVVRAYKPQLLESGRDFLQIGGEK